MLFFRQMTGCTGHHFEYNGTLTIKVFSVDDNGNGMLLLTPVDWIHLETKQDPREFEHRCKEYLK